jgi:hypothetical protein
MMTKNVVAAAFVAVALGGCSMLQPEEKLAAQPGADHVELTKEQGGKFLAFVGPKLQHADKFLGVDDTNYYCLRSWLDTRNGETAHQLYVEDSYFGTPLLWNGAHDKNNKKLEFVAISRNEITCDQGCSYADEFAAVLPEALLRAHRDDGLTVIFTAGTGKTLTTEVPARLIKEELLAVDSTRAALAENAKTPPAGGSPAPSPAPAAPAPAPAPAAAAPAPTPAAATPVSTTSTPPAKPRKGPLPTGSY